MKVRINFAETLANVSISHQGELVVDNGHSNHGINVQFSGIDKDEYGVKEIYLPFSGGGFCFTFYSRDGWEINFEQERRVKGNVFVARRFRREGSNRHVSNEQYYNRSGEWQRIDANKFYGELPNDAMRIKLF